MDAAEAKHINLLIVDDDAAVRDSIKLALESQHLLRITLTEAANVENGIHAAKQVVPDVIILDLHMPDKTGFEFMDMLAEIPELALTRVVMLTGDNTMENVFQAESKRISPYRFLGKPFDVSDLLAVVYDATGCQGQKKS